jgi:predicted lipid-binding transport protein (Tim44 family)|tara:strand:- start:589 stop:1191 length:603 start_codon:yes stop_codon:yes gene_type:complete
MNNNFGFIDIILLGMIAGFIILRLRNILGRKTGHQDKSFSGFDNKKFEQFKKQNIQQEEKNPNDIEAEKKDFLKGAEIAYESIILAFAKGDKKKLKGLLSSEMASNFQEAIDQREKENIKSELTFVSMKESKIEKYEKIKNEFYATVKFVSEIISVKKNKENTIIEGSPDKIKTVIDHWTFTKNIFTKNPNWHLSQIVSK